MWWRPTWFGTLILLFDEADERTEFDLLAGVELDLLFSPTSFFPLASLDPKRLLRSLLLDDPIRLLRSLLFEDPKRLLRSLLFDRNILISSLVDDSNISSLADDSNKLVSSLLDDPNWLISSLLVDPILISSFPADPILISQTWRFPCKMAAALLGLGRSLASSREKRIQISLKATKLQYSSTNSDVKWKESFSLLWLQWNMLNMLTMGQIQTDSNNRLTIKSKLASSYLTWYECNMGLVNQDKFDPINRFIPLFAITLCGACCIS